MASPVAKNITAANGPLIACGRTNSQAGTSLTVADFLNQRVFQRVVGAKDITVTGTYTGSPSVIEARVVDYTSGTPITAWTVISIYPTGGVYSGTLPVPQGCWYRLQVRDGVNTAITAQGSNKFGVGIIMLLFGQSNMANFQSSPYHYPLGSANSVEYESSVFRRVGNINDAYSPNTLSLTYVSGGYPSFTNVGFRADGYVYLANLISSELQVPVCLVERAVGGQTIEQWFSGSSNWSGTVGGNPGVVLSINAIGGDFELALWLQGESNSGTSKASMLTSLSTIHNQCKTLNLRNDNSFSFGIVSIGPCSLSSSYSGASDTKIGVTRSAHVAYANSTLGAFYLTGIHDTNTSDGIHITGEGFSRAGSRNVKSILARLNGRISCGPRIYAASRSGLTATLFVAHTGGTALTDGAGGNGSSLTGFQFFDAGAGGAEIGYTATLISGNTIIITLASLPIGALTVSYAMQNAPHNSPSDQSGNFVAASAVYDNAIPFNSTVGMLLQPLSAIPVN